MKNLIIVYQLVNLLIIWENLKKMIREEFIPNIFIMKKLSTHKLQTFSSVLKEVIYKMEGN